MILEDLAYAKAAQYGREAYGDRLRYYEWLSVENLRCDESAIDEFETLHEQALEELEE